MHCLSTQKGSHPGLPLPLSRCYSYSGAIFKFPTHAETSADSFTAQYNNLGCKQAPGFQF